jgi:TldD protein
MTATQLLVPSQTQSIIGGRAGTGIDAEFLALPLDAIADVALQTAREGGASWADVRVEASRDGGVYLHDAKLETTWDANEIAIGVRVVVDGAWGFASDPVASKDGARRAALAAVALARLTKPLATRYVELVDTPLIGTAQWSSVCSIDPFKVAENEKIDLLAGWSAGVLDNDIDHVDASCSYVKEQKFYADLTGNRITQQRVRIENDITATKITNDGRYTTLRTLAAPTARGFEYLTAGGYDWTSELAELPTLLKQKAAAPSVQPGDYDLVIDPTNLWLTIHESIGHATELDRILGYEANYAGTTFLGLNDIGNLRYGSSLLNVIGDRSAEFGLSTVGYDDEGVAGGAFPIITEGVLTGVQSDRASAAIAGLPASTGCAFAESASFVPLQRMPNISMQPDENGSSLDELIAGVEDGLYVKGDDSWSIDMQRRNFQFTGQQFWRIKNGKLDGQVRDAAYQSTTQKFWGSLNAVGDGSTYHLGGALNCGKGQPGQGAPVSHGAPAARFEKIRILNTTQEQA